MKRILFALATLGGIVFTALLIAMLTAPSVDKVSSYQPQIAKRWVETNPNRPDELRRQHDRDEFGRHTIDIFYMNDNTGKLVYRSSGALESELIVRSDGLTIKSAAYAENGKDVVSGFELRVDGTLAWKTDVVTDHVSFTTVYWADGQTVYGTTSHNRKSSTWDIIEHDMHGTPVLLTQSRGQRIIHRQVEFHADGKIFRERVTNKDEKGRDIVNLIVYRPDSTIEGRQVWEYVRECDPSGGFPDANGVIDPNAGCVDILTFKRVELFSADGLRIERVVDISETSGKPSKVTDFNVDGSKTARLLTSDKALGEFEHRVYQVKEFDVTGKEWRSIETPNGEVFRLHQRFLAGSKFTTNLLTDWKALETAVRFSQP